MKKLQNKPKLALASHSNMTVNLFQKNFVSKKNKPECSNEARTIWLNFRKIGTERTFRTGQASFVTNI